jgi:hypothetical protein
VAAYAGGRIPRRLWPLAPWMMMQREVGTETVQHPSLHLLFFELHCS